MKDIELPEPVGFRSRYRSEPGMIGHYPWTYADHRRRKYDRPECEYEDLYTADQLRAAVEADRAQRVPDGKPMFWVRLCSDGMYEGPIHDKQLEDVRRNSGAWSPLYLASTPAPAQHECWCETCDLAQGNPLGRTRMSLCPECGDKRCPRAKHHDNAAAQHQEPPQQERKPMSEYGWLIENGKKQGEGLAYRFVDNDNGGMTGWTSDHNKALRFARRQDAEQFAYHDEDAFRITQHALDSIPSDHGIKE